MIKVKWSKNATVELLSITDYWTKRNKSTNYSLKIRAHIDIAINLIKKNHRLGIQSNINDVHMRLILKNYYLIYGVSEKQIDILQFWDARQNPIKTKFEPKESDR